MQYIPATAVLTFTEREKSRLDVFIILGIVGAVYGALIYAVPTYTSVIGRETSFLLVPWIDFTWEIDLFISGADIGIGTDMGLIAAGFVIPKWIIIGVLIDSIFRILMMNSLLVYTGIGDWAQRYAPGVSFQKILQESTIIIKLYR